MHFPICFFRRPALTSDSNAFKYLKIALYDSRSDKLLILSGCYSMKLPRLKALTANVALHYFSNGEAQQPLSQRVPMRGSNSCLDFLLAMNWVTLLLWVDFARLGEILSLNFDTCLAMSSLCWYGQGFHLQFGMFPNLPFNVVQSAFDTLAKLEK